MMRFLLIVCSAVAGLLTVPAYADYKFCNKTSYVLNAALGYSDKNAITTEGWTLIRPGQCATMLTGLVAPGDYYTYAEAIEGHVGEQRVWAGDYPLCVARDDFAIKTQEECAGEGREQRLFKAVAVPQRDGEDWLTDFVEPANYDHQKAESAGVQRLLVDLGYEDVQIDGFLGRKTRVAITAFKSERGVTGFGLVSNQLIDALIEAANEKERTRGLFLCNDLPDPIWTAIALPVAEGEQRSRGWWRLEADECAKVVKGQLAEGDYYVYASAETDSGERPLAGGQAPFCINSVLFDIDSETPCDQEGFGEAAFKAVEIQNRDAWTYRFTLDDFIGASATGATLQTN